MSKSHMCWDPKDGEICLNRVKPEEIGFNRVTKEREKGREKEIGAGGRN